MPQPALQPIRGDAQAPHSPRGSAVAGALLGLSVVVIAFAPASWLAYAVARGTQGQVQLQESRGSVWHGSARLVLTGGADSRDRTALPSRLSWSLSPNLRGARASLASACCTTAPVTVHIEPRWQGLSVAIDDSQTQLPAELLTGLGTPWNTVDLQGQLRLATQQLKLQWQAGRLQSQGRTRLEALAVSSRLSPLKPLGSYRLDITGGENAQLELSTLQGDLQLSGQGQWVGSRLRFRGEASASPEREAVLSNLLNILGRRQGGRSIITFG